MKIKLNENMILTYTDNGRLEKVEKPLDSIEVRIYSDIKLWYQNGKIHRDYDKPAVIKIDGSKEWWINDRKVREEK